MHENFHITTFKKGGLCVGYPTYNGSNQIVRLNANDAKYQI